jgi:hypothetical protein
LRKAEGRGVPETGQWSCCAFVFVDQATEDIAAVDLLGGWRSRYALAGAVALRRPPGRLKANLRWDQIAKTSSSNATTTRRLVGSSTASS